MPLPFCIIIPARFASTRFPGKPLVEIQGISMIRRVYDIAISVPGATDVFVATDDQRIAAHVSAFGRVIMTSDQHPSGTDRCQEAYVKSGSTAPVVVNLQGDEPFIKPEQVLDLVSMFDDHTVQIATLKKAIYDKADAENPNFVKVVCTNAGKALYFSRSRVPYLRETGDEAATYRHIGMYAYRAKTLSEICKLPPGMLEQAEKLEQLRWLENGYHIAVAETHWQSPAVDSPEDLDHIERWLAGKP